MHWRLQPCALEAATVCIGGCNRVHRRLQPCVIQAATMCMIIQAAKMAALKQLQHGRFQVAPKLNDHTAPPARLPTWIGYRASVPGRERSPGARLPNGLGCTQAAPRGPPHSTLPRGEVSPL